MIVFLLDLLRTECLLILFCYALARPWTSMTKNNKQTDTNHQVLTTMNYWLDRLEKNFYVKAIFFGDMLERQLHTQNSGRHRKGNSALSVDLELGEVNSGGERMRILATKFENTKSNSKLNIKQKEKGGYLKIA